MFTRTPFNYDADDVSLETAWVSDMPSLTQQQFKAECDINNIAKQFGLTGQLPGAIYAPTFGDFTEVSDFQSALHAIQNATNSFMELPSSVRSRFQNDPALLVEFCSDPRNAAEAATLGLTRSAPPKPTPVPEPVNPTPSAST